MRGNKDLQKAKKDKKDEFYTQLVDIEKELKYYKKYFKDKVVFCNCDDPYESNFFKYFALNFNELGLKKLISTSYISSSMAGEQVNFLKEEIDKPACNKNKKAVKIEITEVKGLNEEIAVDLSDIEYLLKNDRNVMTVLKEDGDFRSKESVELLKEADIVVTNPPFSLFREYMQQLMRFNKKFIILGNMNAVTYKEVFPLIKDNKVWYGQSIHSGDREFRVPDAYPIKASGYRIDEKGRKFIRVKGVRWFTNLDIPKRHEELILNKTYYGHEDEYPKYDNYDAINVDRVKDIPADYFDTTGVPITFLDKYNPKQFEIIGEANHGFDNEFDLFKPRINGKDKFKRLLIKKRCNGVIGVPITFLDKYNPDQFELLDANNIIINNQAPKKKHGLIKDKDGTINGIAKYSRIVIKRI